MGNKNDNPLTEIDETIPFEEFKEKDYFSKIAVLESEVKKEKISVKKVIDEKYSKRRSLVYVFVIDGFIQKIGSTTTSMKDRISSYNCGKKKYRENGTCSTTNFFVLQSFLNLNKEIEIFAYFPEVSIQRVDYFGEVLEEEVSQPSKNFEKYILERLKKEGRMPILCSQT